MPDLRDDRPTPPRRPPANDPPGGASSRKRAEFPKACAAWLGRFPPASPVYALPPPLVAALKGPMGIDAEEVRAERLLEDFCRGCSAVGVRDGRPVVYRWLAPGSPEPAGGRSIAERNRAATRGPGFPLDDADLRIKGYLGRLLAHPGFLVEFAGQREAWSALPDSDRPPLPLRRQGLAAPGAADRGFAASFDAFCDRWALEGAAAWDLPEPQTPVVACLPSSVRPAGVLVALPFHLDLEADPALLRRIHQAQRERARAVGLDAAAGGLANYEAFARMLEVQHWESVATGRYLAPGRRPTGFVDPLVRGIAWSLGLKESQVKKVRKTIAALRKGRDPSSIAALRTRS